MKCKVCGNDVDFPKSFKNVTCVHCKTRISRSIPVMQSQSDHYCKKCFDTGTIDVLELDNDVLVMNTYACDCHTGQNRNYIWVYIGKEGNEKPKDKDYVLKPAFQRYVDVFKGDTKSGEEIDKDNDSRRHDYLNKKFNGNIPECKDVLGDTVKNVMEGIKNEGEDIQGIL